MARKVENPAEVHPVLWIDRAEAGQIREHRKLGSAGLELVHMADLAVAVAIGGIREFERQKRLTRRWAEEAPAAQEYLTGQLRAHEARQEVVHDDPLVVPG